MKKSSINFRGEQMNMLEARAYLIGLNLGIVKVNLDENEKIDYDRWKRFRENRNDLSRTIQGKDVFKNNNQRMYLIESLENKIESVKIAKKREYCSKYGHKGKEGVDCCIRCGSLYDKNSPFIKETKTPIEVYNPFGPGK
ncbi:MAG: hypothetical protein ACP5NZ_04795 [Nanobdellota archaeon]